MTLAFALLGSLCVGLSVAAIVALLGAKRIDAARHEEMRRFADLSEILAVASDEKASLQDTFAEPLRKTRIGAKLASDYERSGQKGSFSQYMLSVILFGFIGFMIGFFYLDRIGLAIPMVLVGASIPIIFTKTKIKQYRENLDRELNDVLLMISGSLKAGSSLNQAFELVATEGPEFISEEFILILKDMRLGAGVDQSLHLALDRVPSENFYLFVQAITTLHQSGGNIVEILEKLAGTMRERTELQAEVNNATAQQKLSVNIIAAMPIVTGVMMYSRDASYFDPMIQSSSGTLLVIIAVVMWSSGYLLSRKIAAVEA